MAPRTARVRMPLYVCAGGGSLSDHPASFMPFPRFTSFSRFFVEVLDYALVGVLAAIGSAWWLVVRFGLDPEPRRVGQDYSGLVVVATVVAVLLFVRAVWRRDWFAARRHWVALGAVTVAGLGVVVWMQARAFVFEAEANHGSGGDDEMHLIIVQGGVFLLTLAAWFSLRRLALKKGWLSMRGRALIATGLAAYLVYLGWDEPEAPSIARNQAVMAGRSEDETSYRLTLRYTPAPRGGGKVFTAPSRMLDFSQQSDKRRAYPLAHRKEIEANWAEMTGVRAWWAELAAQSQLGDRSECGFYQPCIGFQPVRAYMQHALAIASLKAIDGDGDGALAMAGEVYVVGARLEPASRTLKRSEIARIVQKASLETAGFIVDNARVSPGARARFAGLLAEPPGGEIGARRLVLTDSASFFMSGNEIATFVQLSGGLPGETWLRYAGRSVNALILSLTLNPQATANVVNDRLEKTALLAEARKENELKKLEWDMNAETPARFQMKNISGRLLLPPMTSGYFPLVKCYWQIEDLRAGLLKRIRESPPTS